MLIYYLFIECKEIKKYQMPAQVLYFEYKVTCYWLNDYYDLVACSIKSIITIILQSKND